MGCKSGDAHHRSCQTTTQEEFAQHYHARRNIESICNLIKSKFDDLIRSKDRFPQKNEMLLKVLCHDIVDLIPEMNELGIEPSFGQ